MLRRLITSIVAIQLFIFGGASVFAEEISANPQNQQSDLTVGQEQNADTNESVQADEEQDEEGAKQTQTDEVKAHQEKDIPVTDSVNSDQNQDINLESNQSQQVATPDSLKNQNQQTEIKTDQDQTMSLNEGQTSEATQSQTADIKTTQEGQIKPDSEQLKQEADVKVQQDQNASTAGTGTMEQTQSVEAKGNIQLADKSGKSFSIKAAALNFIEITKGDIGKIIKVIQKIFINDKEVDKIEKDYVLTQDGINQVQGISKSYQWGTLDISNEAILSQLENGNVGAQMLSKIELKFILEAVRKNRSNDEEEEIDVSRDMDDDGISDFLEVTKFKTDPSSSDTDGDGLTDLYEIVYHDLSKTQYFHYIHLSGQQLTDALTDMEYAPKELDPTKKDTDGNGIIDSKEEFINKVQQLK